MRMTASVTRRAWPRAPSSSREKLIEFLNVVIVDLALDGTDFAAIGMIGSYERPSPASQQTQSRPAQAMPPLFVPSQPPATIIDDRWLDVGFLPPLAGGSLEG